MKSESDVLKICQHFMACGLDKTSRTNHMNAIADIVSMVDDDLFKDPPPKEECPICMLPMPFCMDMCGVKVSYQPCCGKTICSGCMTASIVEIKKGNMKDACGFCRVSIRCTDKDFMEMCEKRMKSNDAEAFNALGDYKLGGPSYTGGSYLPREMKKALELWHRGAELGSCKAQFALGATYMRMEQTKGVNQNMEKYMYHLKRAAMGGHEVARYNLGNIEKVMDNVDGAMKHFMISAKCGYDKALKAVGFGYKAGHVTKDDYASTLRAHQQTANDMKSEQRTIYI